MFNKNVTKREKHFAFVDTLSGVILKNLSTIVCYSSEVRRGRHNVMMQFYDFKHNLMNHLKSKGGIWLYI